MKQKILKGKVMLDKLNDILLSNNVVEQFHNEYVKGDFRNWLLGVLPEVEDCKNLKQDNPWHVYNCLDHILHSVEAINKQTVDLDNGTKRMLAYTMFLHDIGKPQCHIRRYSKLYDREVDSFFNHNKAGVKIADRVLDDFEFNKTESSIIKKLIDMHDIFMFVTLEQDENPHHQVLTNKYIDTQIEELNSVGNGENLLKYLIMIGRADNLAQNPVMTGDSLHLLDVFDSMLDNVLDKEI